MTSGEHTKGTESGPNIAPYLNLALQIIHATGGETKRADEAAHILANVTAVNTYPAVEGLVKALEETLKFIESQMHYSQPSYDSGLEPSDQFTYDAVPVAMGLQDALSRFRSLQKGGAE